LSESARTSADTRWLADVPHDFRDVVVLVDIGEFSYQDAAQILDIPVGTVMSRLHRGRRAQRTPDQQPLEEGDYFLYNRIEAATGETEEERVLARLSQDNVAEALSAVPHDFRDVVVLVDIGDFSYADAAQILDIPIGTVMSRLHRGRRILKKELADVADVAMESQ
jgi:RNA polymerase sigma-70 factor (ECF subfamily)